MKILALPAHLALAVEVLRRLGALDAPKSKRAPARAAQRERRTRAPAVPALPATFLRDDELRLVAPAPRLAVRRAVSAPRLGRAWAVRVGTGERAVGRPSAPGLWL